MSWPDPRLPGQNDIATPLTARGGRSRKRLASTLLLIGGTGVGQAVMLGSLPVITRLFTPAEFGALAVFLAIVAPVGTVAGLRYDMAIPVAADDGEATVLFRIALTSAVVLALVLGIAVGVAGPHLAGILRLPGVRSWWWVLPAAVLMSGWYNALSFAAIRAKAYARLSASRAVQGLAQVATQVGLGLLSFGGLGLLLGVVARFATSALTLMRRRGSTRPGASDMPAVRDVLRRFRRFPLFVGNASLLTALAQHLPSLAIVIIYGPATAGLFSLAIRALEAPVTLVSQMSAQVYYGSLSEAAKSEPERMPRLFRTTLSGLFAAGLFPFVVFLFGPRIFPVVFGPSWVDAGTFARLLAFTFLVRFLARGVGAETLTVTGRFSIQLWLEALKVLGLVAAFIVAAVADLTSTTAIGLYAGVMAAAHVSTLGASYVSLRGSRRPA